MEKMWNMLSVTVGYFGGLLVTLLGGFDGLVITFIAFIIIDYITGILKSIYKKEMSSQVGYKGIVKKFSMILIVGVSVLLEKNIGIPALREIVLMFFVANEGISILENTASLDIPLPEQLKTVLLQIREKNKEE